MATDSLTEPLRETMACFDGACSPLTTSEVSDSLDVGRRSTYERLDRLVDRGRLDTKKVGASARVWWRPRAGQPETEGMDRARDELATFVQADENTAIFRLDAAGRVRTWNRGAERIKGYERASILGDHVSTFYTADDRQENRPAKNLARAAEEGGIRDEGWRVRADGTRFWADVAITPVREEGTLVGYLKVTRDTTRRRQREAALRQQRNFLDNVLETTPAGIAIVTPAGRVRRANRRFAELLGLDGDAPAEYELGDQAVFDETGVEIPYEQRPVPVALNTGEAVTERRVGVEGDRGRTRWLSVTAAPFEGDPGGVVVTMVDVTRHEEQARRLERQRDEIESELEEVLDRVEDGIFALDERRRITYVNDRASDLFDRPVDALVGEFVWEALDAGDSAAASFEEAIRTQDADSFEWYYESLDAWFDTHLYPSESGLSVYFRDVTDRVERRQELERYASIVDALDQPVYEVDDGGRLTFVNDAFVERSGHARSELVGEHVSMGMDEAAIAAAESEISDLLADDSQDTATLEYEVETRAGDRIPVENRIAVLTDDDGNVRGSAGVLRDVTERNERRRELVQFETLFEESRDVNVVVDETGRFRYVTPSSSKVFGYEPEALVGDLGWGYIHPEDRGEAVEEFGRMVDNPDHEPTIEFRFEHSDGSWIVLEAHARNLLDDPDIEGIVIYTRDVTERIERERQLEESRRRYRALVDNFPNGAVALVDSDLRYRTVGGQPVEGVDATNGDLEGERVDRYLPDDLADLLVPQYEAALAGDSRRFEAEVRGRTYLFRTEPVRDDEGAVVAALGMSQDVTERRERERELERYERIVETIGDGVYVLDADHRFTTVNSAFASLTGHSRDALVGDHAETAFGDKFVDIACEKRSELDPGVDEVTTVREQLYTADDRAIVVENRFGLIELDDGDVGRVGVVHDVSTRVERERRIQRQREQLAALDAVNDVVRSTTHAVIDRTTREEIAETVCEHLAGTALYDAARLGEVEGPDGPVSLTGAAGVEASSADGSALDDRDASQLAWAAIQSGEMQVTTARDAASGEQLAAPEDGDETRASAAIPIVYDDTVYGVLQVCAQRPGAFQGKERTVIGELGEVVGHAIAATERKQALMGDEVVQLEFLVDDVYETWDVDGTHTGRIRFDRAVALDDEAYLVYGTADAGTTETLERLVTAVPHWVDVTLDGGDDVVDFEVHLSEPPVLSALASLGGAVEEAVIDGHEYRMTVRTSPSADVRQLRRVIREAYPAARLVKRKQFTVSGEDDPAGSVLQTDLTDRQRTVLEAAYLSGFFEWPRDTSGEAVAESMDISPPTFHQHLRKAERKVFDRLLSDRPPAQPNPPD